MNRRAGWLKIAQIRDYHSRKLFTFIEKVTLNAESSIGQKMAAVAKENLQLPPVYIYRYGDKKTGGVKYDVLKGSNILHALIETLELKDSNDSAWHYEVDVQWIESDDWYFDKKDLKKAKRTLSKLLSKLEEVQNESDLKKNIRSSSATA
jgi:hypothetical protein